MSQGTYTLPTIKNNLPTPRPARAGSLKSKIWAILAILSTAALAWWFTSDLEQRQRWSAEAASVINNLLRETPLAGIGNLLVDSPPAPPPQVLNPETDPGTLSGRRITGTIGKPQDSENGVSGPQSASDRLLVLDDSSFAQPQTASQTMFSTELLEPVSEDSRIRPTYIAQVAHWLADNYKAGANGGTISVGVRGLNQQMGAGISRHTPGGRQGLARYVFQPSMIEGLYGLYIGRFMRDLDQAARDRGMDRQTNRQFHLALAGRAALVASALEGIAAIPDLNARLAKIWQLADNAASLNADLAESANDLENLRGSKADSQRLNAARLKLDGVTARYRRALDDHASAQRNLAELIRKNGQANIDDDSALYLAEWVERRLAADTGALAAIKSCVRVLRDLASRCSQGAQAS